MNLESIALSSEAILTTSSEKNSNLHTISVKHTLFQSATGVHVTYSVASKLLNHTTGKTSQKKKRNRQDSFP